MKKLKSISFQIICIVTGMLYWICLSNMIIIQSTDQLIYKNPSEIPYSKYALVLGTSKTTSGNRLNYYFKYRLAAAIELFEANKIEKIIVSGDNSIKEYDETTDMANYLIEKGIPDSCIIRDYAGFRTLDSVVRAKKVFNATSLTIISQEFHLQRALFIAKYYNLDAIGFVAPDVKRRFELSPLREYLAKFGTIIDLFFLNTQPKFL